MEVVGMEDIRGYQMNLDLRPSGNRFFFTSTGGVNGSKVGKHELLLHLPFSPLQVISTKKVVFLPKHSMTAPSTDSVCLGRSVA